MEGEYWVAELTSRLYDVDFADDVYLLAQRARDIQDSLPPLVYMPEDHVEILNAFLPMKNSFCVQPILFAGIVSPFTFGSK